MTLGVTGFKEVEVVENTSTLALATFDSPTRASKFIRYQRKKTKRCATTNCGRQKNRSKLERMRCKAASKLKKQLVELVGFAPKDVIVSYNVFQINARVDGKCHWLVSMMIVR